MISLWLLLGLLIAAPIYTLLRLKLSRLSELQECECPLPQPNVPSLNATTPEVLPSQSAQRENPLCNAGQVAPENRIMRWISTSEFIRMLSNSSDLIVIDLRPNSEWSPFPVPNAFVLPVSLKELDLVLERLPADKSAVFYGASNLCIFMIETCRCMEGSAPLYILEGDLNLAEVA